MKYEKILKVDKETIDFTNLACEDGTLMDEDDLIFYPVVFPDGMIMDIKCCGSQSEYEEFDFNTNEEFEEAEKGDGLAWCEAVLFDECVNEIAWSEPSDGGIGGEWQVESNGNIYFVNVIA